jgi:hypothetical protein
VISWLLIGLILLSTTYPLIRRFLSRKTKGSVDPEHSLPE